MTPHRREHGFTLLEMLVVMAVLAILLTVVSIPLIRWRNNANAENFVQAFSAQMNLARSLTLSTGVPYRVNILSASSFELEKNTGTWVAAGQLYSNSSVTINLTGARIFTFNDRGLLTAYTTGTTTTLNTNVTAQLPSGATRTIIVTALGLTRAV